MNAAAVAAAMATVDDHTADVVAVDAGAAAAAGWDDFEKAVRDAAADGDVVVAVVGMIDAGDSGSVVAATSEWSGTRMLMSLSLSLV